MSLHTISVHRTARPSYGIDFHLKSISTHLCRGCRREFGSHAQKAVRQTAHGPMGRDRSCYYDSDRWWQLLDRGATLSFKNRPGELETHEAMRRQQLRDAIAALAASNRAIDDWRSSLCAKRLNSPLLTTDLQEMVDRANGRPLLLSGLLKDVKEENGSYIVSLTTHCGATTLRLEMTMDPSYMSECYAPRGHTLLYPRSFAHFCSETGERVSPDARALRGHIVYRGRRDER